MPDLTFNGALASDLLKSEPYASQSSPVYLVKLTHVFHAETSIKLTSLSRAISSARVVRAKVKEFV